MTMRIEDFGKMKKAGSFLTAMLLACSSAAVLASPLGDKMSSMSESGRRAFTGMIVRQTGEKCESVRRTFFQGNLDQAAVWNVECNSGDKYGVIFSGDEGNTTRVLKCSAMKDAGAPPCFRKI